MRILHISDHADPLATPGGEFCGGQNVYVRELARRLADSGCTVDVVTRWADRRLARQEPIAPGARTVRVPAGPVGPLPRERFGEVLDEFCEGVVGLHEETGGYDVVHSHYWYSAVAALRLGERHPVPLVHTHHSLGAMRRAAIGRDAADEAGEHFAARHRIERRIGLRAAAVVASSPGELADLERQWGTPRHTLHMVPPGVDTAVLTPRDPALARAELGLPGDAPVVLFVGRLEPRKGLADLVSAFALVRRAVPGAVLVVVGGEAPERRADPGPLAALVERHGLRGSVDLRGPVPHAATARYYSAADVTAVPSHYEPFGLVAVESMACGTPVVATRVGGLRWSVADPSVGTLVPPRNPAALAKALVDVLTSGTAERRQACLDRATSVYCAERWADDIRAIYRRVAAPHIAATGAEQPPLRRRL
ncbi:glycosyltransferase [Streptomyces clavuligerus]|uniref:Glycosyl transferase, group 1 n=1 Tax=Streptomyces clavuligerus TaxID=1901 RepID=B5GLY7_STRCL|nr:glycosyltransferase [Streptomyces clavuligerus]EDY47333.1 glycosyl transferase [Streptomyces clavuligerus]EFG04992.1 Glycosyl transferase, group 1 [Streptomyces clavuligerus]MBY6306585.1 glycosyltransferase [Streptomyces clavuligerus]QCS10809.1 glycosyltransferase family 1 protein [Streptomyces clavuligerus]QPJ97155.1 glycosyltransferase [Streptomyces clavuligerus]